jgi:nitrate/nitrite-specific signal transduction histidine kinase
MSSPTSDYNRRFVPALLEFFTQSRFGVEVMLITLLFLACVSFFIYQVFAQQYQNVADIFAVVDPNLKHELVFNDIVVRNLKIIVGAVFVYMATMAYLVMRTRQKYLGPLVAVQKFIETVSNGDYSHRITIRKGDELQDLIESLNNLATQLEARHGAKASQTKS